MLPADGKWNYPPSPKSEREKRVEIVFDIIFKGSSAYNRFHLIVIWWLGLNITCLTICSNVTNEIPVTNVIHSASVHSWFFHMMSCIHHQVSSGQLICSYTVQLPLLLSIMGKGRAEGKKAKFLSKW